MKKILALAASAVLAAGIFAGCGKSKDKSGADMSDKTLIKAVETMYEAACDKDTEKYLTCMFPKDTVDDLQKIGASELILSSFGADLGGEDFEVKEVKKSEDLSKEDIGKMEKVYSLLGETFGMLADKDITFEKLMSGDVDEELIEEFQDKFGALSDISEIEDMDIETSVKIEAAKKVTYIVEEDGEEDELDMTAYKIKGEDVKLDILFTSLIRYVDKSAAATVNSHANSLSKAFSSAIVDADSTGINCRGVYIFSSDKDKEVYESTDDRSLGSIRDEILETVGLYFDDYDKYDYFAVVCGGDCQYVVVNGKNDTVGTYPINKVITGIGDSHNVELEDVDISEFDYEELYEVCLNAINH